MWGALRTMSMSVFKGWWTVLMDYVHYISLMCWTLLGYVPQSDMLGFVGYMYVRLSDKVGFVGVCPTVWYVGLCGVLACLICWALWGYMYVYPSDLLGFVQVYMSVWYVGGTCTFDILGFVGYVCQSDMLSFVGGHAHLIIMLGFIGLRLSFWCWTCVVEYVPSAITWSSH